MPEQHTDVERTMRAVREIAIRNVGAVALSEDESYAAQLEAERYEFVENQPFGD